MQAMNETGPQAFNRTEHVQRYEADQPSEPPKPFVTKEEEPRTLIRLPSGFIQEQIKSSLPFIFIRYSRLMLFPFTFYCHSS
jgi:hypothetical protein